MFVKLEFAVSLSISPPYSTQVNLTLENDSLEAWRDLQYIGDVKAGKFMGQDEYALSNLLTTQI